MSRLSAHLHFGMVSPFRVARDALAAKSFGAGKFVDEYLTWREVAYAFCFYHSADLDTLKVRRTRGQLEGRPWFVDVPRSASRESCCGGVFGLARGCPRTCSTHTMTLGLPRYSRWQHGACSQNGFESRCSAVTSIVCFLFPTQGRD